MQRRSIHRKKKFKRKGKANQFKKNLESERKRRRNWGKGQWGQYEKEEGGLEEKGKLSDSQIRSITCSNSTEKAETYLGVLRRGRQRNRTREEKTS